MFAPRLALASLFSLLVAGLTSAVTFSPEFEKSLEAGLDKIKQDVQEYPKLQSAVDGIPMDVKGWAALSRDDIVTTLKFFSNQKADASQSLLIVDPANADKTAKFTVDSYQVVILFVDNIKSGAFTSAPVPSPERTSAAPVPATTAPVATTPAPVPATTAPVATTPAPTPSEAAKTTENPASTASNTTIPVTETGSDGDASSLSGSTDGAAAEVATSAPTTTAKGSPVPTPSSAASRVMTIVPAAAGVAMATIMMAML